jgi:ribosome-associated protein
MSFSARELALLCARVVDQKGGEDVLVLQLPATAHSFDYAVLVTAGSDRLTNALVEECWHFCKRHQVPRMPVEGESGWMLIDCYDVVVHALSQEKREFYQLDTLWPLAKKVDWAKEVKALPDPDKAPAPVVEEAAPAPKKRAVRGKKSSEPIVQDVEEVVEETADDAEAAPTKRATKAKAKAAKPKAKAKPAPEPVVEEVLTPKTPKTKRATRAGKQQGEKGLDLASVPLPNPAKRPRR